jgi:hypothetical protein
VVRSGGLPAGGDVLRRVSDVLVGFPLTLRMCPDGALRLSAAALRAAGPHGHRWHRRDRRRRGGLRRPRQLAPAPDLRRPGLPVGLLRRLAQRSRPLVLDGHLRQSRQDPQAP